MKTVGKKISEINPTPCNECSHDDCVTRFTSIMHPETPCPAFAPDGRKDHPLSLGVKSDKRKYDCNWSDCGSGIDNRASELDA